jgi:hypothetical protein
MHTYTIANRHTTLSRPGEERTAINMDGEWLAADFKDAGDAVAFVRSFDPQGQIILA